MTGKSPSAMLNIWLEAKLLKYWQSNLSLIRDEFDYIFYYIYCLLLLCGKLKYKMLFFLIYPKYK